MAYCARRVSCWRMMLCWSSTVVLLNMAAMASGELEVDQEGVASEGAVVRYWEATLHGGSMPSSIRAMLSPLTSHQTTQLLLHFNAYLPTHAASFCKAAHIQCGVNVPASGSASSTSAQLRQPAKIPIFTAYRKASGAALEAAKLVDPVSHIIVQPSQPAPGVFMYNNYRKLAAPGLIEADKVPTSNDAQPADPHVFMYNDYHNVAKDPASNAQPQLFSYNHYRKASPALMKAAPAIKDPAANAPPPPVKLFIYTNYRNVPAFKIPAQPRKALQSVKVPTSDIDAPADQLPFFYANYQKNPSLKETKNPVFFSDAPDQLPFFYANYQKSPSLKVTKNPMFSDASAGTHLEQPLFMYHDYRKAAAVASHIEPVQRGTSEEMTSSVHKIAGSFFREKQVLVSGVKIDVSQLIAAEYNSGAEEVRDERAFLPRKLAQAFDPFSSEAGAEQISSMLGVSKVEAVQDTIDACKVIKNGDEVSACLTSVEDISDFVASAIGSHHPINAYDSLASNAKFSGKTFLVQSVNALKQGPDAPSVTCHDMAFPFRVFYCHYAKQTMIFHVTLRGEDGTSHKRIAVCHYDTSYWDPNHVSFAELHTKPGEAEACHWLGKSWMGQSGWVFAHA